MTLRKSAIAFLNTFHNVPDSRILLGTWLYRAANDVADASGALDFSDHLIWDDDTYDHALEVSEQSYNRIASEAKDDQARMVFSSFAVVHLMILGAAGREMDDESASAASIGRQIYDGEHQLAKRDAGISN